MKEMERVQSELLQMIKSGAHHTKTMELTEKKVES
jgi:hypothetical protein